MGRLRRSKVQAVNAIITKTLVSSEKITIEDIENDSQEGEEYHTNDAITKETPESSAGTDTHFGGASSDRQPERLDGSQFVEEEVPVDDLTESPINPATFQLAAAHVDDALKGRGSLGKSHVVSSPPFKKVCFAILDNQWWHRLLFMIIILHTLLAFFEPNQEHIKPGEMSTAVVVLNVLCTIAYIVDVTIQMALYGWHIFWFSPEVKRSRVEFFLTLAFIIDAILLVIQEHIRLRLLQPFRCIRPAMLYARSRNFSHIFDVCACIILSLGKVLLLVLLYVFVFAVAALHLYMDDYHYIGCPNQTDNTKPAGESCEEDDNEVYTGAFDNIGIAFLRMFVMISSENYPALMIPAYKANNANFLFFGTYIYFGIFVITSVFIAQVVEKYWYYSRKHIKQERMSERAELAKAWKLIDIAGDGHIPLTDARIRILLGYVKPKLNQADVDEVLEYIDENADGDVDAYEWTTRLTDALNYDFIRDPLPWTVSSPEWLSSLSKTCRKAVMSRPFNAAILVLITIHSLMTCLKWHGMSFSTEVIFHGIRTSIMLLFVLEIIVKCFGLGRDLWEPMEAIDLVCSIIGIISNLLWYLVTFALRVPDATKINALLIIISGGAIFFRLGFISAPTKKIMSGFMKICPVMIDLILFVAILIYLYAILGLELFYGFHPNYAYDSDHWGYGCQLGFDSLGCSMLEVFQICTTSNWHEIMNAVMLSTSKWAAVYFVTCFCIVDMIVMNLFVAITIEAFKQLANSESDDQKDINPTQASTGTTTVGILGALFATSQGVGRREHRLSLAAVNERRRSVFQTEDSSASTPDQVSGVNTADRQARSSSILRRRREQVVRNRLADRRAQGADRVRVVAAYRKSTDDELDLHVGDEVQVLERRDEVWKGSLRGRIGWFPVTHVVEFAHRKPRPNHQADQPLRVTKRHQLTKRVVNQDQHSLGNKFKIRAGHGEWRRKILGDLTIMNSAEMLEINRIIHGEMQIKEASGASAIHKSFCETSTSADTQDENK